MLTILIPRVDTYGFFTPKTIPDRELLKLPDNDRHEIALHIANDPVKELKMLEKAASRKVRYYPPSMGSLAFSYE